MNGALISIGIFKPALRKKAIAAAKRIGKVEVDHGETNCMTPDAVPYIEGVEAEALPVIHETFRPGRFDRTRFADRG